MMNAVSYPNAAESSEPVRGGRSVAIAPDYFIAPPTTERTQTHASGKAGKIVLPTMEGMCFEKVKHIAYLEASGNYTVLHFLDGRQILVCKTLREV
ncbi:MAG: hypothetical protein L6Q97_24245, partial [Thermoanaerobaculia bacterium]|nr:hypothetical protein [Thermoanaerobaculia bacterium]